MLIKHCTEPRRTERKREHDDETAPCTIVDPVSRNWLPLFHEGLELFRKRRYIVPASLRHRAAGCHFGTYAAETDCLLRNSLTIVQYAAQAIVRGGCSALRPHRHLPSVRLRLQPQQCSASSGNESRMNDSRCRLRVKVQKENTCGKLWSRKDM